MHRLRAGFTLDVRGNTSTIAANLYDNWVKVLQEQRKKLRTILPTIAEVINWVDIENQHDRVRLMAHVDRGMVARLKNLPDDIERILVSQQNQGNGGEVKTVAAIGSDGEKIDEKPNLYTGTASVDDLTYQPDEKLKTAANQDIVGPFSVFINDARYDRKSDKVLIHIKSVATNIPNIGNNSARLQLLVDKAIRKSGQSAVVNVTCGPKRINKPARFIKTSDDNYVAEKTLELSPGINTTDMGAVSGKVVLKLPTSTSINTIPARGEVPRKETFGDVTLTLNSVGTSGFSYEVKGNVDKLIEIRALNKDGKYLKVQNKAVYEKGSSLAGGTLAGNLDFYGVVDTIEIVTAQTIVKKEYPFHLNEFSNYYSDHYGKIRAPTKKLLSQKEFERKAGVICPAPDKGKSNSQSGPFCVQLTDIVQQNGLWMNFVVGSARVAELEDNRSLMTLHMDRAVLRDDRAVDLDKLPATITAGSLAKMKLSSNINFTVPWDVNDQLVGQTVLMAPLPVQLGLLKAMYGKLTVKLPKKLEVRKIKHLRLGETLTTRQLSLTLVSQGVDGYEFLVTKGSDRLLQMVPRDSLGRAIDYEITKDKVTPDGLDIAFKTGEVSSVDVHIAKKVKTITYPVQLL